MRACLFVLFITILSTASIAQVKVGATPTGKHAKYAQTAKDVKSEAEQRKEQAKEVAEYIKAKKKFKKEYEKEKKKRKKEFEKEQEKVKKQLAQEQETLEKEFDKEQERFKKEGDRLLSEAKALKDSLKVPKWEWNEKDSLRIANEIFKRTNFPEEYKELIQNPPVIKRDTLQSFLQDSAWLAKQTSMVEQQLEQRLKQYAPEELAQAGEDPLKELTSNPLAGEQVPGLDGIKKPSKPNPNLIKPAQAKALFQKIDPEKFQQIQTKLTKLKKKYSSMPDTRFPEEAKKRNSLEDLPFKDRLYFGGTINAASTDPFILDANLQLGYWINKKWMAGGGFILREQFTRQDSVSTSLTGDAYGYSFFTRYDILKEFYAWGEMQRQINRSLIDNEAPAAPAVWQESYLVGVGRDFKIGPVRLSTLIMYDFNYQNNTLNNRPIVFRIGFQVSKKP